jgi:nicotinamide-nucleotide amidase
MSTLAELAQLVGDHLLARGEMLVTAESCTGGMVAAAITDNSGSSAWFECGHVTYSNAAKSALLNIPPSFIEAHGAVSEGVARAMVVGALANRQAQVALAITGIAGPNGGSANKPVGTVHFAWMFGQTVHHTLRVFPGDRRQVREAAARFSLEQLALFLA